MASMKARLQEEQEEEEAQLEEAKQDYLRSLKHKVS